MVLKEAALPWPPLNKAARNLFFASFLLTLPGHFGRVPIWALFTGLGIAGWRFLLELRGRPRPRRSYLLILAVAVSGMILLSFHTFFGLLPGSTALLLLSSLKILEMNSRRDFRLVILLSFLLVLAALLNDQTIPALLYALLVMLMLTAALLAPEAPAAEKIKGLLRRGLLFGAFALPCALVFFFLFPRSRGPLFLLPQETRTQYTTGFRDFLRPGQVASLAQSKEIAFRVSFPGGDPPEPEERYFRGAVLWQTDGHLWTRGRRPTLGISLSEATGRLSEQLITPNQNSGSQLFALDFPVQTGRLLRIIKGQVLQGVRAGFTLPAYRVVSILADSWPEELNSEDRELALQLPERIDPRVLELARSWRRQAGTDFEVVVAGLGFFSGRGFRYSTSPGLYSREDFLSEFLLVEKKGFCEHYAAAFTLLMRLAGVPARVVNGYQGGTWNPVGNYLVVRQADAHAWSEVWLPERGWQRIDPTARVIPERLSLGSDILEYLESGFESEDDYSAAMRRALQKNFWLRLLREIEYYLDVVNNKWNLWIVSFDRLEQRRLWRSLGFPAVNPFLLALLLLLAAMASTWLLSGRRRFSEQLDPTQKTLALFLKKISRQGLGRRRGQGMLDFCRFAAGRFALESEKIIEIGRLYNELRYGPERSDHREKVAQFRRLVRRLELKRAPGTSGDHQACSQ